MLYVSSEGKVENARNEPTSKKNKSKEKRHNLYFKGNYPAARKENFEVTAWHPLKIPFIHAKKIYFVLFPFLETI